MEIYDDDVKVLAKALISRHVRDYIGSSPKLKKEAEEWLLGKGDYLVSFSDCCRVLGFRKEFIVSRLEKFFRKSYGRR